MDANYYTIKIFTVKNKSESQICMQLKYIHTKVDFTLGNTLVSPQFK